jgi:hypothetical protein
MDEHLGVRMAPAQAHDLAHLIDRQLLGHVLTLPARRRRGHTASPPVEVRIATPGVLVA